MRSIRATALATLVAIALSFAPSAARADHDLGAEIMGEGRSP